MADTILLESGTNEVELLEFYLEDQSFGINVAKISQILPFDQEKLTVVPNDDKAILGSILWHKKTVPLIDLSVALNHRPSTLTDNRKIVLVTEFNGVINGFLTDGVNRIFRVNWGEISPISSFLSKYTSTVTGSIKFDEREILLVDFEFVVAELFPDTKMGYHNLGLNTDGPKNSREMKNIVFAEDSPFIRSTIIGLLNKSGYTQVTAFENGQDAFNFIEKSVRTSRGETAPLGTDINLVISDIEMPKMDGLTLCRAIKEEMGLTSIPVIIFSSLVNDQMIHKCQEVGANGYTTKPQVGELLHLMDKFLGLSQATT
jgi:two-component system chemotaxis response regulator CheV